MFWSHSNSEAENSFEPPWKLPESQSSFLCPHTLPQRMGGGGGSPGHQNHETSILRVFLAAYSTGSTVFQILTDHMMSSSLCRCKKNQEHWTSKKAVLSCSKLQRFIHLPQITTKWSTSTHITCSISAILPCITLRVSSTIVHIVLLLIGQTCSFLDGSLTTSHGHLVQCCHPVGVCTSSSGPP